MELKMVPNNMIHRQIVAVVIAFFLFGCTASLRADEIPLLATNQPPVTTRTLCFPPDQCLGNLNLEPESGPGWDPKYVRLYGEWEYYCAAQGDVLVPEDRNVQLIIYLALSPQESEKLRAQNPQAYQMMVASRIRKDPADLSGLSQLDPNDLFALSVYSAIYQRTGTMPGVFEPIRHLTGLQILNLTNTGIIDKGMENLRALYSLKGLELSESSLTSRGLAVLRDLPALEYLGFDMPVTDADLGQIAQAHTLRWLRIRTGKIWGPGLAQLANMPRLERLCIWGTSPISDRHITYLEGLTGLKSLTLWGGSCNSLTDASLETIGKLKNLEELYFIRAVPRFTVGGVAYLKNLTNLKKVDFAQTWCGPAGTQYGDEVVRQLTALTDLESIKGLSYLSADGMKQLTVLKNLKCLDVSLKDHRHGYNGPTGVSHLASLGSLEELHLTVDEPLSDADLASLEPLTHLRELFISAQKVTERGMVSIGKLRRLEKLTIFCPVTRNALNQLNGLSNLQHLQVNAGLRGNTAAADSTDELMLDLSGLTKMKDMNLSGLQLQDIDLAFLKNMPLLEDLMIQPNSTLSGKSLLYLTELPELNRLFISQLSDCADGDLAHLNNLSKLRDLTITGDINDAALSYLKGLSSLWSLRIDTDEPISKQTVTNLKQNNPVIEYLYINELTKVPTRPRNQPDQTRVSQPRTKRLPPASRRRDRK
jgi:hypothetical protein